MSARVLIDGQHSSELFNSWLQEVHNIPTFAREQRQQFFDRVEDGYQRWCLYVKIRNLPKLPL